MVKLLFLAVLWFGAVAVFGYGLFQYLNARNERKHEREMTDKEHDHEERQTLFGDE